MPALEEDWVQSKLTAFHQAYPLLIVSPATSHSLASSSPPVPLCVAAVHVTRKQEPKLYLAANNMDPGSVPLALQGLTQVEEMLISPVMPIMSLGQYGYSGHVINLPQDAASFVCSLPRMPSQLDVVVVRKEGVAGSHKDFKVRQSHVLQALRG